MWFSIKKWCFSILLGRHRSTKALQFHRGHLRLWQGGGDGYRDVHTGGLDRQTPGRKQEHQRKKSTDVCGEQVGFISGIGSGSGDCLCYSRSFLDGIPGSPKALCWERRSLLLEDSRSSCSCHVSCSDSSWSSLHLYRDAVCHWSVLSQFYFSVPSY